MTSAPQFFRPVGSAIVFRLVELYDAAGFIPAVYGVTLDGTRCIHARIKDVVAVSHATGRRVETMTTYHAKVFIGRELQPRTTYILTADDEQAARQAAASAVKRQFPRATKVEILMTTVEG